MKGQGFNVSRRRIWTRFSVIANEIRKLGGNSRRQIEVIKKSFDNIEDLIKTIYELHLQLIDGLTIGGTVSLYRVFLFYLLFVCFINFFINKYINERITKTKKKTMKPHSPMAAS